VGSALLPDDDVIPRVLVFWGINPIDSSAGIRRESIRAALLKGTKLVVIDPKRIDIAKRADMWIRPRPQSDGPLAMGLIKVVIEEKLYDEDIVTNWTVGFDQLSEHIKTFTLDDVERVTWVPRRQIEQFARLYAQSKPAQMQLGNALEQGINCLQAIRAINILRTICGHVNVPGGDIFLTPVPWTRPGRFFLPREFPRKAEERALGSEFKLAMKSAYIAPQALVKAILEEKPYPVKAALGILTDPLVSYPDSEATCRAFMKLDLFVISELFHTPSTAIADIVLPAAWGAEHDSVGYWPGWYQEIRAYPKLIEPPGEAWADHKWISELADRLGLGQYFWKDEIEVMDYMLEPSGLTWEQFKKKRILKAKREYRKPEDGVFKTPSGKVELYSKQLEDMGYSPMPLWEELCRFREDISTEYPLLLTNRKEEAYMLTGYKHVAYSRNIKPEPTVELNPETAREAGLEEGDMVYIETKKGRIEQKLVLDPDLDPRVIFASFGWWFPEETSDLYQFRRANVNLLIDSEPPYDDLVGAVELRGIPCKVYKA
jgi:anaerobic selenocysteine-containing dehydrogenase